MNINRPGAANEVAFYDLLGKKIGTGTTILRFNHIVVPFIAGYRPKNAGKCSLSPAVGLAVSYNYSEKDITSGMGTKTKQVIPGDVFRHYYRQAGVFGLVQLSIEFKIAPGLSIVGIPRFDYMVSDMLQKAYVGESLHPYTFDFNAGIKWTPSKTKKKPVDKK